MPHTSLTRTDVRDSVLIRYSRCVRLPRIAGLLAALTGRGDRRVDRLGRDYEGLCRVTGQNSDWRRVVNPKDLKREVKRLRRERARQQSGQVPLSDEDVARVIEEMERYEFHDHG